MQQVVQGIHGFPMSRRPLLRTRDTARAVSTIHSLVEPFSFDWEDTAACMDIQLTGTELDRLKLFGVRHGAAVLVRSSPLQNYYIVLPLRGRVDGRCPGGNFSAGQGEALVFPTGCPLHARWAENCIAMVLSIPEQELEKALRVTVGDTHRSLIPSRLNLHRGAGRSIVNILACLNAACDLPDETETATAVRESLQNALLSALLRMNPAITSAVRDTENAAMARHRAGVVRAVNYLKLNLHRRVDPAELAGAAYLSKRNLQIGFAECFGMGPVTYSKRLRLQGVREELRNTPPGACKLSELARRWGFYCDNTFRRLYRRYYGELPSHTLEKCSSRKNRRGHNCCE